MLSLVILSLSFRSNVPLIRTSTVQNMAVYTWSRIISAFRSATTTQTIAKEKDGLLKGILACSQPQRAYSTENDGITNSPSSTVKDTWSEKIPTTPYVARNIKYKQALARRGRRRNAEILHQNKLGVATLLKDERIKKNMPLPNMKNPYTPEYKKCVLCQEKVVVDYKNPRLLSQFVSPYTGRIYGRHLTGLCIPMQKEVARQIKISRQTGFMPYLYKKVEYRKDPVMYDHFIRPRRK